MNFWSIFLCVLTFFAVSLVLGWAWFSICGWDELFNCRNYKRLALVIPTSFLIVVLVVGFPTITQTKPEVVPQPTVEKKVMKKPAKKPKKPKKKETEDPQNNSEDDGTPRRFEDSGENQ